MSIDPDCLQMKEPDEMNHIFVYVLNRPEDPFEGIKDILSRSPSIRHTILDIRLNNSDYQLVRTVEYSVRKHIRFLFYRRVFASLRDALTKGIEASGRDKPCVIYFSDEGVWAEFLRNFLQCNRFPKLLTVNVQHGFEHFVRPRYRQLRRFVNWLSCRALDYPLFGMGSFGGVGGGVFDIYLTYDAKTADFINKYTNDLALSAPLIIKKGLIDRYKKASSLFSGNANRKKGVLYALQPQVPGSAVKCGTRDVFHELTPLAKLIVDKYETRMMLRLHPGMDKDLTIDHFGKSEIRKYATIDAELDLAKSLAHCAVIMSYDSTVLWEAGLVGLVPVCVWGGCFKGGLAFPHETIRIKDPLDVQLLYIFNPETARKYHDIHLQEHFDWETIIMSVLGNRKGALHP